MGRTAIIRRLFPVINPKIALIELKVQPQIFELESLQVSSYLLPWCVPVLVNPSHRGVDLAPARAPLSMLSLPLLGLAPTRAPHDKGDALYIAARERAAPRA